MLMRKKVYLYLMKELKAYVRSWQNQNGSATISYSKQYTF